MKEASVYGLREAPLELSALSDDNLNLGLALRVCGDVLDFAQHLKAVSAQNLAKHVVAAVQPETRSTGDEELTTVRV